ncbi:nucleotidyltransferase substrate binding protein [Sulfuricurvum sp.]|uniref:nucleotidyltransferase substrate binding protein n=1 Tax=Sulfuricurvum sp. TaxID=2025608 RepID=UPI0026105DDD|nr:nucleotidyltransferase substrate binding protein [Sulfuricurvum sp.]MDD3594877.1 nucleotidyltransferase substrate binding protein [Sulfuricurvum sp.]
MALNLDSLIKSIESLSQSLQASKDISVLDLPSNIKDTIRAGVIQNFEVCYEQSWKMMKRWLEENVGSSYVDGVTRRELFRVAFENKLIDDVDRWMDFHKSRNETSHTYDQATAEEVFSDAEFFVEDARFLLQAIEARND